MCPKVLPSSSDRFILCSLSGWSCLVSQLSLSALRWQLSNQYLCFRISPQSSGSNLNAHWLFLIGYFVSNSNMLKSDFSLCKLLLLIFPISVKQNHFLPRKPSYSSFIPFLHLHPSINKMGIPTSFFNQSLHAYLWSLVLIQAHLSAGLNAS